MLPCAGMSMAAKTNKPVLSGSTKKWIVQPMADNCTEFAKQLKISPLLAQTLINRGITDIETGYAFLRPKLNGLIGPEKMPGIGKATERIVQALKNREKICVYGDYDVDGIAGVAILETILRLLGAQVDYYIPHRIDEGYGLNEDAVRSLAQAGNKLLITVDCGITAIESARLANNLGMEVIITDHHQPSEQLPQAIAIVHPMIDESYPNQNCCGAAVAFKLAWAVANEFSPGAKLPQELRNFLINATTLAGMATIADCLDLTGENRIITSYGLRSLSQCNLCGIGALVETAGLAGQELDSYHIGFRLAPMLNAAGRMGHARLAVELLTTDSQVRAMQIAQYLKDQNSQRQKCEKKIFRHACDMVVRKGLNHPDKKTIVLSDESWHSGVIGIVASRLVDKFYRPTIMINAANGIGQGSARSIAGFNILAAISACSEHLVSFGGHKMAAGINIEPEKIESFAGDVEAYAQKNLKQNDMTATLGIDAIVPLGRFTEQAVNELGLLEPFGVGNPKPTFATKGVRLASPPRKVGEQNNHLQLTITDNTNTVRCVGFNMGKLEKQLLENDFFNVAYRPQINTYNGNRNVEFVLADIRFE